MPKKCGKKFSLQFLRVQSESLGFASFFQPKVQKQNPYLASMTKKSSKLSGT